jgi:periplasmic divalent cation tolerance protein
VAACVVLTSVADRRSADRLSRLFVKEGLAACVTALPGAVSHYRWKKKFETSREILLLIKTDRRSWPKLLRVLKSHHPYELPEALMLPAAASKEYLAWINGSLRK